MGNKMNSEQLPIGLSAQRMSYQNIDQNVPRSASNNLQAQIG